MEIERTGREYVVRAGGSTRNSCVKPPTCSHFRTNQSDVQQTEAVLGVADPICMLANAGLKSVLYKIHIARSMEELERCAKRRFHTRMLLLCDLRGVRYGVNIYTHAHIPILCEKYSAACRNTIRAGIVVAPASSNSSRVGRNDRMQFHDDIPASGSGIPARSTQLTNVPPIRQSSPRSSLIAPNAESY